MEQSRDRTKGLIQSLRNCFSTYGILDEITTDGGPIFTAGETWKFFKCWCTNHRLSSVAYPHGNCRAEVGVKIMKQLITKTHLAIHDDLRYLPAKSSSTSTPTYAPERSTTAPKPTSGVEPETNSDMPVTPETGNTEPSGSITTNIQQPQQQPVEQPQNTQTTQEKKGQPEKRKNVKDYHTIQTQISS